MIFFHDDECKTHIFLSGFFLNIWGFKVHFNVKLWSLHPDLCFIGIKRKEEKISKKSSKNG